MKRLFGFYNNVLERHPVSACLVVLLSHYGFGVVLVKVTSIFPDHSFLVSQIIIWIWLAWMLCTGIPMTRKTIQRWRKTGS
ncbi:hypothetical protein ROA7450_02925 [Roseovarius albus]|uniref:Uncharacterized protein n=1 Tax=Roseovarius albus TaxID=1247867 RepID=A0A1X6ZNQ9_9RHOB|nr:hypothetical protein ROA7450_02925 [Roseovarius albus]